VSWNEVHNTMDDKQPRKRKVEKKADATAKPPAAAADGAAAPADTAAAAAAAASNEGGFSGVAMVQQLILMMILLGFAGLGGYMVYNPDSVQFLEPIINGKASFMSLFDTAGPASPDVLKLDTLSFDTTINSKDNVLVEFYAPWCGHCKSFARPYGSAATALAGKAVLACVDGTVNQDLLDRFEVKSFPTIKWFQSGDVADYTGKRTREGVINWVTKRTDGATTAIVDAAGLDAFKASSQYAVVVFADQDAGHKHLLSEFEAAAMKDDVAVFGLAPASLAPGVATPSVVLYDSADGGRQETWTVPQELSLADGALQESISGFVAIEKTPVVYEFAKDVVSSVLNPYVGKAGILLGGSKELQAKFAKLAAEYRGQMIFINGPGGSVDQRFRGYVGGLPGANDPQFVVYTSKPERNKYPLHNLGEGGAAAEGAAVEAHIKSFLAGNEEAYFKSEEAPAAAAAGEVAVVVGKTFDSIAKDSTKSVFLKVYAPWCGHCKKLSPIWDELATHYAAKPDNHVVLAKLDYTVNEHKDLEISGFPTLIWYGRGEGTEPIPHKGGRDFESLKEFIDTQE